MEENFAAFKKLFEKTIGFDTHLLSDLLWRKILRERMAMCSIANLETYYNYVQSSPLEFQELVELIVVTETWFFRDKSVFEFLKDYVLKLAASSPGVIRILCLACSSGEEAYSIVMSLLDAHFPMHRLIIDAVDISKKALSVAEFGQYEANSFRSRDLDFRKRYFKQEDQCYLLDQSIRQLVHFSFGNLVDPLFGLKSSKYDVVLCRNLLIYFHTSARKKAIEIFSKLLNPSGVLIVSDTETSILNNSAFIRLKSKGCVYFKNGDRQILKGASHQRSLKKKQDRGSEIQTQTTQPSLEEARRLADARYFKEALEICQTLLEHCSTNAEAYLLSGLIELARNHFDKAEVYFQKTVYLIPDCYEALVCLAVLAEKKGDHSQAEIYRQWAKRAQSSI